MTRTAVRRLTLTEFRSYRFSRIDTTPSPVVLAGSNGAGKTNLLEAISLLVPGRGLRGARLPDLRRRVAEGAWGIAAQAETLAGAVEIGTGAESAETGARRLVRIDGVAAKSQTVLGDYLSAIWLTPQMDRLFMEGAAERRRFLDRLVYGLDPAHAPRSTIYGNAMRQRAILLRERSRDQVWLRTLEETMASAGTAIAAARRGFIDRLNVAAAGTAGAFPHASVDLGGSVDRLLLDMPGQEVEARFRDFLFASRERDAETGGASVGPHRSDMVVSDRGGPAAQGSTGEQKALLVSLVLTAARLLEEARGAAPLLLLDEVAAHLDAGRRAALFEAIVALGAQAWLTGTEPEIFTPFGPRAQFFRVHESAVIPI